MTRQASGDGPQKKATGKRTARSSAKVKSGGASEKKSAVISLRHLRLRILDIEMTDALEQQRGTPWPDLSRRIYERGAKIEAACGPPDEEGRYGTYSGRRLAELLAGDVEMLITFQMRHGMVPTIVQVLLDLVQKQGTVPASILSLQQQGERSSEHAGAVALTEVEEGAAQTLDIFFQEDRSS